jgi:hypothetical protein
MTLDEACTALKKEEQRKDARFQPLRSAFEELRELGYFAKMNWQCCTTCGWAAVPDNRADKVVFFHGQDADNLVDTGECYLALQEPRNAMTRRRRRNFNSPASSITFVEPALLDLALDSPARTTSAICLIVKPCATTASATCSRESPRA